MLLNISAGFIHTNAVCRGETALGYITGEQLFLVPPSESTHHFSAKDSRIIVLAKG